MIFSIGNKTSGDRKSRQIVGFQFLCDRPLAPPFEDVHSTVSSDVRDGADEGGALVLFVLHAIEKIFNPFLIARVTPRAPSSRMDSQFVLQCIDDDARIVGDRRDFRPLEVELCFLDGILREGRSRLVRNFLDLQVARGHDRHRQSGERLADLDHFAAVRGAEEEVGHGQIVAGL